MEKNVIRTIRKNASRGKGERGGKVEINEQGHGKIHNKTNRQTRKGPEKEYNKIRRRRN